MKGGTAVRFLLTAAVLTGSLAALAAKGRPSIADATASLGLVYSPDADSSAAGSIVVGSGGWQDAFYVVFTQRSLTDSDGDPLEYALFKTVSSSMHELSLDGMPADETQVLSGAFTASSLESDTMALPFSAVVSCGGIPSPDAYTAVVRADLYEGSFSASATRRSVAHTDIRIEVTVGEHLDVSVVPGDSSFALASRSSTLSFGAIEEGDSGRVDLVVRSNIAYDLHLTSANGALARAGGGDSPIAYVLQSNGVAVGLSAGVPAAIAAGAPATYGAGCRYAIVVTVSPFTLLPSKGDYADAVTVTVSAP